MAKVPRCTAQNPHTVRERLALSRPFWESMLGAVAVVGFPPITNKRFLQTTVPVFVAFHEKPVTVGVPPCGTLQHVAKVDTIFGYVSASYRVKVAIRNEKISWRNIVPTPPRVGFLSLLPRNEFMPTLSPGGGRPIFFGLHIKYLS